MQLLLSLFIGLTNFVLHAVSLPWQGTTLTALTLLAPTLEHHEIAQLNYYLTTTCRNWRSSGSAAECNARSSHCIDMPASHHERFRPCKGD